MESVYFKCLADNIVNYQKVVDTWDPTDPASDPETLEYYDRMLFRFILEYTGFDVICIEYV